MIDRKKRRKPVSFLSFQLLFAYTICGAKTQSGGFSHSTSCHLVHLSKPWVTFGNDRAFAMLNFKTGVVDVMDGKGPNLQKFLFDNSARSLMRSLNERWGPSGGKDAPPGHAGRVCGAGPPCLAKAECLPAHN